MWGIQVNVGHPGAPNWQWLLGHTMTRTVYRTQAEAEAQKATWYPDARAAIFRVWEITTDALMPEGGS